MEPVFTQNLVTSVLANALLQKLEVGGETIRVPKAEVEGSDPGPTCLQIDAEEEDGVFLLRAILIPSEEEVAEAVAEEELRQAAEELGIDLPPPSGVQP